IEQNICKAEDSCNIDGVITEESQGASHELEELVLHETNTPVNASPCVGSNQNRENSGIIEWIENEKWYKTIDSSGRFVCKFCNLAYLTTDTVRRHTLSKHPEEARELQHKITYNWRYNKCHICKNKFKQLRDLQCHLKSQHSIGDSYFCHRCQAMFDNKESLLDHLQNTHKLIGSNLYVCRACGYATHKVSHFNQHQKIHSQTKSHKCGYCNYATNNMPNLRIHEQIHEKNKIFKCKYKNCIYLATTRSALRSHELVHNKEKHFMYCDKCTYKTVYKQSLKKHKDSHDRNTVKAIF
ncbi:hypothetical protein ABMA28_010454, partial [Loxostege sticticalis]